MASDARQRIARAEKRARMSLYYSRIYGAYANMTATFETSRTRDLYEALPAENREQFPFDITEVDWRTWMQGTHLPALTTKPNRKKRKTKIEEKPGEVAAIFDVDGTLVGSNVVSYFAWLRMRELPPALVERPAGQGPFAPGKTGPWPLVLVPGPTGSDDEESA